ncbi:MAG: acetyl-CoA carboxylase carboxyltransferase subunit beta [Chlamydiia bacterium]|nr:acetyl-CoA carboxylase carboxyltransferase subunit beta [Chlamydiia bacterium]
MRLFSWDKPKIKKQNKGDGFSGWIKCDRCAELTHASELETNLHCCPKCDHHYRMTLEQRLNLIADTGSFAELFTHVKSHDILNFTDTKPYPERIEEAQEKTGRDEAITVGTVKIHGKAACLGIMNFQFMGGSMGTALGEKLTLLIEYSLHTRLPLVVVSASGGARMQESTLSLMQMAKTSAALAQLSRARIPYISVLTNPTSGGVTASFASLGDIILAEPDALICFAGPRVIEQTIGQKLPEGAQRSEFLLQHGMIDCIVKRHALKEKLAQLLQHLQSN